MSTETATMDAGLTPVPQTPERRTRTTRRPWGVIIASLWVAVVVVLAIIADLLPLHPFDQPVRDLPVRLAPGFRWSEPLGTDSLGRSVMSRLIFGARETLIVAVLSTLITMAIGTLLGMLAGISGKAADEAVTVVFDVILSFPSLVLLLTVAAVGDPSVTTTVVGLSIIGIPIFGRLARAATESLASRPFVTAARALGATRGRILFREILPSVMIPVGTYAFLYLGFVTVAAATLSFLGAGTPPPAPSWGSMVYQGSSLLEKAPQLVLVPSLAILITVVSFMSIGEYARRRFVGDGLPMQ